MKPTLQQRRLKVEISIGLSRFFIELIGKEKRLTTEEYNKLHSKHLERIYDDTKGIFKEDL